MNAVIYGRRKQGKSTLALRLCLTYHKTVIIFDPNSQFRGLETVTTIEDFAGWMQDTDRDHGIIVFRPTPGEIEEQFQELVDLLWPLGNYALLVDEASCIQNPHSIEPALERLMRQAPRDQTRNQAGQIVDVTVIQTVHRPADAHSLCRSLATDEFYFQTSLARDLTVVEKQSGSEVAATLRTLPRFHCCHVYTDINGRREYAVWNNPASWYIAINDLQS